MAEASARIVVEIVYALPERYWSQAIELAAPACVADALQRCTLQASVPGLRIDPSCIAVHGRSATAQTVLHDGDRIELLRPLQCDPKEVRRRRAGTSGQPRRGPRTPRAR